MADTPEPTVISATPSAATSSTPVGDASAASSETVASSAPNPADSTTAAPAASAEAAASSEPAKAEAPVESILGDAKPKEEAKPVESAKVEPAKADGDKPVDTKIELPAYEEFKLNGLPEGVKIEKESLDAFTKILGEVETGKLDHKGYQEAGQKLIDLAAKNTVDSINRLNDYYAQFHENQKKEWFEEFKKDPDLGGDKLDETVGLLRDAVERYAGSEAQVKEFRQLMKDTGVGNHPALTRLLYNMQQKINKYETEADNGNGGSNRMVPGQRPAPSKVKDYQRFYQSN